MKKSNYKSKVTKKKLSEVEQIKSALLKYKVICIFDLKSLPSKQLQSIRHKLRKNSEMYVKKKRLLKLAIEQVKQEKDLSALLPYLEKGIPALLVTNEDPFSVYKTIKSSKSLAAAKPGQIAPKDLIVEAGPTNFPPGPIIGELGQAGIIAAVEQGKVTIKKETTIAKKGDIITQKKADVLSKLGIQPMEIGMSVIAAFEQGIIYAQEILDVDEQLYLDNLRAAIHQSYNFTLSIGYVTRENAAMLIKKAFNQANHLAEKNSILTSETVKSELKKAEFAALKLSEKIE
ncbi:MAG TPA: 50S ribosomal protein L10 [Candidatus Nanoarchaeia archaeon]|nr:50S ribosomal protein L10 [Candidatus Nanoarchaeia archaeon]